MVVVKCFDWFVPSMVPSLSRSPLYGDIESTLGCTLLTASYNTLIHITGVVLANDVVR